ncbi:MAG: hemerythrin domain-containing protein [Candidatus Omnitrophica bacterium]|nr:hemerythrin domain-containing protein [Candidatus Omnitrophota bacterium]
MQEKSVFNICQQHSNDIDSNFIRFQNARKKDLNQAKKIFRSFKENLEKQILWEENVLFPFFEKKTGMHQIGPTFCRKREHENLQEVLKAVEDKLDKEDGNIEGEERHILSILEIHSNKEEQFVFKKIDEIASKEELKEIFAKREK